MIQYLLKICLSVSYHIYFICCFSVCVIPLRFIIERVEIRIREIPAPSLVSHWVNGVDIQFEKFILLLIQHRIALEFCVPNIYTRLWTLISLFATSQLLALCCTISLITQIHTCTWWNRWKFNLSFRAICRMRT